MAPAADLVTQLGTRTVRRLAKSICSACLILTESAATMLSGRRPDAHWPFTAPAGRQGPGWERAVV